MNRRTRSATPLSAVALIALLGLVSACTTASPATTSTPSTNTSQAPLASGVPSAAPTSTAGATAAAPSGGTSGTCKYLSDTDAATLLPTAGLAKVTGADTPAGTVTSCHWGAGNLVTKANVIQLVVDEFKIDVALEAAKKSLAANVKESIAGLGDGGGFSEQSSDIISIEFFKGKKTVQLVVAAPGMTPAAVSALAQKIAATL